MKEGQWLTITFFICLIIFLSISIDIIWQPFIHAEDGIIFLNDAMEKGIHSLFITYGGYFVVLSRMIAIIAICFGKIFNSFILVTSIMKWCTIIYTIICVNYINSKDFEQIIKNRILRLVVSILAMLVMANHIYMIYNATGIHWWGGLLAFIAGLVFLTNKTPSYYIIPFLILAILSSPSALLIAIPIIFYIVNKIWKEKNKIKEEKTKYLLNNKFELIKLIIIAIAGLLQVYAIIFVSKDIDTITNPDLSIAHISSVLEKAIIGTLKNIPYSLKFNLSYEWIIKDNFLIGTGIIMWILLFYRALINKQFKIVLWCFLEIFILYFMDFYKIVNYLELPGKAFYNALPAFAGILAVVKCLSDDYKRYFKFSQYSAIVGLGLVTLLFYNCTEKPDFRFCKFMYEIEDRVDFNSDTKKKIRISPGGDWHVDVPYFKEKRK